MKLVIVVIAFFSSWICFSQISTTPDTVTYNTSGQLQGGGTYNVLSNDTRNLCNSSTNVSTPGPLVSGISLTGATSTPFAYFTIQSSGAITVNADANPGIPNFIPSGSYVLNYTVCELGTTICQTQTVTIFVTNTFKMAVPELSKLASLNKTPRTIQNTLQIINFPDANLKTKLLDSATCFNTTDGNFILVDANNDGEIDTNEALQVGRVNLNNANINDLEGMEYFTNLTSIGASLNNLTEFTISLPNLSIIGLQNNPLTIFNTVNLPNLYSFTCANTQITSLNLSNNPLLFTVGVNNTLISNIDVGTSHNLVNLYCKNNPNLTSINIKNTSLLDYSSTFMQQDCWTNCPNLTSICADSNEIPALQSFLSGCGVSTAGIDINSNCALGVADFNNEVAALYPNPVKNSLHVGFANTTSEKGTYAVYDVLGKKVLENTVAEGVDAITILFENQANGVYLVKISVGDLVISKKVVKE